MISAKNKQTVIVEVNFKLWTQPKYVQMFSGDFTSFSTSVFISFKSLMCPFLIMRILDSLV